MKCRYCAWEIPPPPVCKRNALYCSTSCARKFNATKWQKENPERQREIEREWLQRNPGRKKSNDRAWRERNPARSAARSAKRRAAKLNATPPWLTQEHLDQIETMYSFAKKLGALTGQSFEVDHIVPLQGENVCGLHVPWNLQLLDQKLNRSKSNKHLQ